MTEAPGVSLPLEGRVDPRSGSGWGRSRQRTAALTHPPRLARLPPFKGEGGRRDV